MSEFAVLKNKKIEKNKKVNQDQLIPSEKTENLTLGNILKKNREEKNYSINDVAEKLHLKSTILASFEDDNFTLPNLPVAFTKGYLKSYLRFLGLPENLMDNVTCSGSKTPMFKPTPIKYHSKSHRGLIKFLTIIVLLIAFGMTGLWWWQTHQKEQMERELLVSSNSSALADDNRQLLSEDAFSLTTSEENNLEQNEIKSNEETTQNTVIPSNEERNEKTSEEVKTATTEEDDELKIEKSTNVLLQTTLTEEKKANTEEKTEEKSTSDIVALKDELRIEVISAPSWITVKGKNNKTLTAKIYKAGETLNFNNNERYRLTIGAPVNVKVYYKGSVIPLKLDGRVARIKLPLN